jgi:hypothetical protein
MRHPHRARNSLALCGFAGIGALAAVVAMGVNSRYPILQALLAVAGLLLTAAGIGGGAYFHGETRRYDRLRAGKGIVARWTVEQSVWQRFLALDATFSDQNPIAADYVAHGGPVEVIFASEGLLVDDDFHTISKRDSVPYGGPFWHAGPPALLVFSFSVPCEVGTNDWSLRVPVPPEAVAEGRRVYEHFTAQKKA